MCLLFILISIIKQTITYFSIVFPNLFIKVFDVKQKIVCNEHQNKATKNG